MRFSIATTLPLALASAYSSQSNEQISLSNALPWHPAGPNDLRGPCPMMNTLANHGYLQHDGRNITKENAIKGLREGLNFDASLVSLMWDQAIIANPEPNATFFTLGHLNRHNVLEHDASLSRMDAYYGNNHEFNPEVFAASKRYWTAETLDAKMLANSKLARMIESRAFNPNYTFTASTEQFSLGEVAAPFIAFGDTTNVTVSRELITYFFEHERLPSELGWTKKNHTMTLKDILSVQGAIRNATSLLTPAASSNSTTADEGATVITHRRRADLHSPLDL